jgi:hypothetical protein
LSNGSSWTKQFSVDIFKKATKRLSDFGILEKAKQLGAVDLANSIESILKAPFHQAQVHGQWILSVPSQQATEDTRGVDTNRQCKRKLAVYEKPSRKRQSPETGTVPTPEEQASDSYSQGSCSPQSLSIASTLSIAPSRSIVSTSLPTQSQHSSTSNHTNRAAIEQVVYSRRSGGSKRQRVDPKGRRNQQQHGELVYLSMSDNS